MGQSAGAGSPVSFQCHACRSTLRSRSVASRHTFTLTGRSRPYRAKAYSALGSRSTLVSREYRCSCGHVGWSNHVDLARMTGEPRYTP